MFRSTSDLNEFVFVLYGRAGLSKQSVCRSLRFWCSSTGIHDDVFRVPFSNQFHNYSRCVFKFSRLSPWFVLSRVYFGGNCFASLCFVRPQCFVFLLLFAFLALSHYGVALFFENTRVFSRSQYRRYTVAECEVTGICTSFDNSNGFRVIGERNFIVLEKLIASSVNRRVSSFWALVVFVEPLDYLFFDCNQSCSVRNYELSIFGLGFKHDVAVFVGLAMHCGVNLSLITRCVYAPIWNVSCVLLVAPEFLHAFICWELRRKMIIVIVRRCPLSYNLVWPKDIK